jgi:hypothetical protein
VSQQRSGREHALGLGRSPSFFLIGLSFILVFQVYKVPRVRKYPLLSAWFLWAREGGGIFLGLEGPLVSLAKRSLLSTYFMQWKIVSYSLGLQEAHRRGEETGRHPLTYCTILLR